MLRLKNSRRADAFPSLGDREHRVAGERAARGGRQAGEDRDLTSHRERFRRRERELDGVARRDDTRPRSS